MKKYKVQITDQALADMGEIYTYIAEQLHAPENAMGQYNRIAETILCNGICNYYRGTMTGNNSRILSLL